MKTLTVGWAIQRTSDSLDVVAYSLTDTARDHVTVSLEETGDVHRRVRGAKSGSRPM